ncbi:helix-turn-helix transcriptional regulator [Planctomicrobium sp. SH664]|uniref:helix-turn-helix transcriptional regulator n=1 Tax=Planctomicrobium sp. SH664 TaxID=3448125 RepID=UPI003F5C511A
MMTHRDSSDRDFLSLLQRAQPAGIQQLCAKTGVTATAVRHRLARLEADGLVTKTVARQSRGRPSHTYSLTEAGVRALGSDHAEIAALLWKEILRIDQTGVRQQVLNGLKESLIERFGSVQEGGSLAGRLQGMCNRLTQLGFDVEYSLEESPGSLPVLREHNCPYHGLVAEDASFCEMEQSVFTEVLGTPVELSACRLDGHHCCEFHVGETATETPMSR